MRGAVASAIVLLGLLVGCGYQLSGKNTFLPERIKVIFVAPFENRTTRPEIEQRVTEAVAKELSKRGGYRVIASAEGADAILQGAITEYRRNPVAFNAQGRAVRIETVVTLQASLRDLGSSELLWSQGSLVFRQQYDVSEAEATYFDQESTALSEIAQGVASTLVSSIFEGF